MDKNSVKPSKKILIMRGSTLTLGTVLYLALTFLIGCDFTSSKITSQNLSVVANPVYPSSQQRVSGFKIANKNTHQEDDLTRPIINGPLTLSAALSIAEMRNPLLKVKRKELEIAQRELEQASLSFINNPEFSVEAARRRSLSSVEPGNFTDWAIEISQEFEVWGQPKARRKAALAAYKVVQSDIEIVEWEILARVRKEFIDLLFATRHRRLLEVQNRFSKAILDLSERQLKSGEISKMQHRQMKLMIVTTWKKLEEARVEEENSAGALLSTLDISLNIKLQVKDDLPHPQRLPFKIDDIIHETLSNHPRLHRHRLLIEQRRHELALVQKEARPNFTGSIFFDREEEEDNTVGISISVPLPIFNRKQGAIRAAEEAVAVAVAEMNATQKDWINKVNLAVNRLNSSYRTVSLYNREVIEDIRINQKQLERSFRLGETDLLELRLSQQELLDMESEALEATAEYYRRLAHVEGLIGHEVEFLSPPPAKKGEE